MNQGEVLDITRRAMMIAVEMSLPSLMAALFVGLIIGLLQALTSIQETTLTFVPKIGAMIAVLWIAIDWMGLLIGRFFRAEIIPMIMRI